MPAFRLIVRPEVRRQITAWAATMKDQNATPDVRAAAAEKFEAATTALAALRDGRDGAYNGKRLGFGRDSHDLSDCAEYKVPVGQRPDHPAPNHRLIYREFEDPWRNQIVDGRAVPNPDSTPFREVVAFEHRGSSPDPAAIAGQRLGRTRGMPVQSLNHIRGDKPSVGPQRADAPRTPPRTAMPPDVMKAARALYGTAPAGGAVNAPNAANQVAANRKTAPGKSSELKLD